MTTQFPAALDNFSNPSGTTLLSGGGDATLTHSVMHANVNDAIEAMQNVIGVTGSLVTSSLQYKADRAAYVNTSTYFSSLGVGTTASGTAGEIRATNDIIAFFSSDATLKENVKPITNALEKVSKLTGVEFDWTADYIESHGGEDPYFNRVHDIGVIAQEVEAVFPEVVGTRPDGIKAVRYDRLVSVLIQAIKELKAEIDELKNNA